MIRIKSMNLQNTSILRTALLAIILLFFSPSPGSDGISRSANASEPVIKGQSSPGTSPSLNINKKGGIAKNAGKKAMEVYVGVYLIRIPSLSLKENKFTADFFIWFRWKDSKLKPYDEFEITNGEIISKEKQWEGMIGPDLHYAVMRVQADITKYWNIIRYPFDRQTLAIELEHTVYDETELIYIADTENSGIDKSFQISGWTFGEIEAKVESHDYQTNWGYPLDKNDRQPYSRFIFSLPIFHEGITYSFKLFYGMLVAVFLSLASLFIKNIDTRLALTVGLLFAVIASHIVVTSNMPDSMQLTIVDKLHILSALIILLIITESIVSLKFNEINKESISKNIDFTSFLFLTFLFISIALIIIF